MATIMAHLPYPDPADVSRAIAHFPEPPRHKNIGRILSYAPLEPYYSSYVAGSADSQRCPRECACAQPFETLLSYQLATGGAQPDTGQQTPTTRHARPRSDRRIRRVRPLAAKASGRWR
jgi:hypothetical protein